MLSQPLPVAFRVNACQQNNEAVVDKLKSGEFVKKLVNVGGSEDLFKLVKWYPNNLVYESKMAKRDLRKDEQLARLHCHI